MRSQDGFVDGQFSWFTGVVEDRFDPEELNRVRVRCFGYHSENRADLETEDLPWATVMMPTTSSGTSGIGDTPHGLMEGSWVVGFFRDGPSAQDPIVMGSIATQTPTGEVDENDNPIYEKDIPSQSSVDNKVYKSKAGHLIEIDNTSGAEKIKITHGKTNSHIEFTSTGKIRII